MIKHATVDDVKILTQSRGIEWKGELALDVCYVVELDGARMLFTLIPVTDGIETHICCPPEHVRKCRDMAREIIEFARFLGYHKLYTTAAPQYKTAHNMARRLDFELDGEIDGEVVYCLNLSIPNQPYNRSDKRRHRKPCK